MKLLRKILLLTVFSVFLTAGVKLANDKVENGKFYIGVSYYMAESGDYSAVDGAIVGVAGLAQGTAYSYLAAAALGGPAGIAVAVGFGL